MEAVRAVAAGHGVAARQGGGRQVFERRSRAARAAGGVALALAGLGAAVGLTGCMSVGGSSSEQAPGIQPVGQGGAIGKSGVAAPGGVRGGSGQHGERPSGSVSAQSAPTVAVSGSAPGLPVLPGGVSPGPLSPGGTGSPAPSGSASPHPSASHSAPGSPSPAPSESSPSPSASAPAVTPSPEPSPSTSGSAAPSTAPTAH